MSVVLKKCEVSFRSNYLLVLVHSLLSLFFLHLLHYKTEISTSCLVVMIISNKEIIYNYIFHKIIKIYMKITCLVYSVRALFFAIDT